jgi:hypothetical protein
LLIEIDHKQVIPLCTKHLTWMRFLIK